MKFSVWKVCFATLYRKLLLSSFLHRCVWKEQTDYHAQCWMKLTISTVLTLITGFVQLLSHWPQRHKSWVWFSLGINNVRTTDNCPNWSFFHVKIMYIKSACSTRYISCNGGSVFFFKTFLQTYIVLFKWSSQPASSILSQQI